MHPVKRYVFLAVFFLSALAGNAQTHDRACDITLEDVDPGDTISLIVNSIQIIAMPERFACTHTQPVFVRLVRKGRILVAGFGDAEYVIPCDEDSVLLIRVRWNDSIREFSADLHAGRFLDIAHENGEIRFGQEAEVPEHD